jgi:hypothetical protein
MDEHEANVWIDDPEGYEPMPYDVRMALEETDAAELRPDVDLAALRLDARKDGDQGLFYGNRRKKHERKRIGKERIGKNRSFMEAEEQEGHGIPKRAGEWRACGCFSGSAKMAKDESRLSNIQVVARAREYRASR